MGYTGLTIVVFIILVIIVGLIILFAKKAPEYKSFYWTAIPSLIIAIWAFCTSWIWIYYACLYLSLPALIVSLILILIAKRFKTDRRLFKMIIVMQVGTLILGFLSAVLFGVFVK